MKIISFKESKPGVLSELSFLAVAIIVLVLFCCFVWEWKSW